MNEHETVTQALRDCARRYGRDVQLTATPVGDGEKLKCTLSYTIATRAIPPEGTNPKKLSMVEQLSMRYEPCMDVMKAAIQKVIPTGSYHVSHPNESNPNRDVVLAKPTATTLEFLASPRQIKAICLAAPLQNLRETIGQSR